MIAQRSLTEFAAALIATGTSHKPATALANGSQQARKAGAKSRKRCRRQLVQCQDIVTIGCATQVEAEQRRQVGFPCCESLATCNATAMLECIFDL